MNKVTDEETNLPDTSEKDLRALLVECAEFRQLERSLAGFNIFRVLRFEAGELRHSNVLAWLLTPGESHGFGERFLRRWLMRVLHDADADAQIGVVELDSALFRSVVVHREWGRIDVLLHIRLQLGDEWIIAVENKIHAKQGEAQLTRYRTHLAGSFPAARRLHLFLTLHDEEPNDEEWIVCDYKQVGEVLDECLNETRDTIGQEPRVLIEHYLRTVRGLSMSDNKLIELARQIYGQHQRALDFIFEHREDEAALLGNLVAKLMRDAASRLSLQPLLCTKAYVRFVPIAWNTPQNRAGTAWGTEGSAYVLCEIVLKDDKPTLKIVVGGGPHEWRTAIFEKARGGKNGPLTTTRKKSMPASWMSVYAQKLGPISDERDADEEAERIWKEVEKLLSGAGFRAASEAVVREIAKLPK